MELMVNIKKRLPEFTLDLSFSTSCSALGLLGESGSGKSITLKCIAGLITPDEGKIVVNDKVFFDSSKKINLPIQNRKIGFLFQNYALFPNMTIRKNISYALYKMDKKTKGSIVSEVIEKLHLQNIQNRYPAQLSGGQQQRAALARALAVAPEALLLDEPFSALDNHLKDLMIKQMMDTLSNYNGVAIFVTHNMDEAYQLCQDIVVLEKGRKKGQGHKKEIFLNPPSLAATKLTGCKNISSAEKIDDYTIKAIDWNCTIRLKKSLTHNVTHIGIRAHYPEFTDAAEENTYNCWPALCSETRFRRFVFFKV